MRFKCHVGHWFTLDSLLAEQKEQSEQSLFSALSLLEAEAETWRRVAETQPQEQNAAARLATLDACIEQLQRLLPAAGDAGT